MLSVELYEQAQKRFENNALRLELLNYIWSYAKDFDFFDGKVLKIPMPTHQIPVGEKVNGIRVSIHTEVVPFGHDSIRKVASAILLYPVFQFPSQFFQKGIYGIIFNLSASTPSVKKYNVKNTIKTTDANSAICLYFLELLSIVSEIKTGTNNK